jgi:hypothetical protein
MLGIVFFFEGNHDELEIQSLLQRGDLGLRAEHAQGSRKQSHSAVACCGHISCPPGTCLRCGVFDHPRFGPEKQTGCPALSTSPKRWAFWWPLATHKIGKAKAVDAVIEPRVGGSTEIP